MESTRDQGVRRAWMAPYGALGIGLLAAAWTLSWSHLRPFSDFAFFPLWLGYIVAVDALVYGRTGRSLLHSGGLPVLRLFVVSAGVWWVFELFNLRTENWHYLQASPVGPLRFAIEASVDFSTVLPAVFETAALVGVAWPGSGPQGLDVAQLPAYLWRASLVAGILGLVLPLAWPRYFFPLVWLGLFFVADSLNARSSRPSLVACAHSGRWRPVFVLAIAGLTCGFLWEMWNFNAMPKWVYSVPLIPQQRLFEMPYLGYSGYISFAFECFALYTLVASLWGPSQRSQFLPAT